MTLAFDAAYLPSGPVDDAAVVARAAEDAGFRTLWIPDQGFFRDPFVLCACAAAATRRLTIGVGITSPLTRHPVHLARTAATLDELSGGRFRLGLGTGNVPNVVRPMGLPADRSVGRVADAIRTIQALLRGDEVTLADGEAPVALDFAPNRRVEVYVGTRGPQMLRLAGRLADGVLVESLFSGDALLGAVRRVADGAERAERPGAAVDVVAWQVCAVVDDPKLAIDRHRAWVARMVQAGPARTMTDIGMDPDAVAAVTDAMDRGDVEAAAAAVTDEMARCLLLIGTPRQLIERIEGIAAGGARAVTVLGLGARDEVVAGLRRFAREVMPAFAGGGEPG